MSYRIGNVDFQASSFLIQLYVFQPHSLLNIFIRSILAIYSSRRVILYQRNKAFVASYRLDYITTAFIMAWNDLQVACWINPEDVGAFYGVQKFSMNNCGQCNMAQTVGDWDVSTKIGNALKFFLRSFLKTFCLSKCKSWKIFFFHLPRCIHS